MDTYGQLRALSNEAEDGASQPKESYHDGQDNDPRLHFSADDASPPWLLLPFGHTGEMRRYREGDDHEMDIMDMIKIEKYVSSTYIDDAA